MTAPERQGINEVGHKLYYCAKIDINAVEYYTAIFVHEVHMTQPLYHACPHVQDIVSILPRNQLVNNDGIICMYIQKATCMRISVNNTPGCEQPPGPDIN